MPEERQYTINHSVNILLTEFVFSSLKCSFVIALLERALYYSQEVFTLMKDNQSETRSKYLALALDARRILDSLVQYVEAGEKTTTLDTFVNKAIESLGSVTQRGIANAIHSDLAFAQYEQILTLDEIANEDQRRAVIDDLKQIVDSDPQSGQRDAAIRALEFFFALESRALQYYQRPPMLAASLA